jgi:hypothetical protein
MTLPPRPLSDYERMPMPSVSNAVLDAIVARHRLNVDGPIVPLESAGVVHALWRLGPKLLLRVPKNEEMCVADHRCEAAAIPLALDAGVRTPGLVLFDDSLQLLPVMIDGWGDVHLIDWGDCGYGDPADDFHALPMRAIRPTLRGYRSTITDDPSLEARIIRVVIARSLSMLRRTPLAGPSWYRPIAATLTDLLTFAIDEPATWNQWTNKLT